MSALARAMRVALPLLLAAPASAARPNVVILLTDDQGYGDVGAHGNPVLRTPQFDRLRAGSVRFTQFHVSPMCTPTRGQLLTGVDALRNGAMNVSSGRAMLRTGFATMPEVFAANGYRTGMFGKWHLGDSYPYRPQDRGFQESVWLKSSMSPSAADHWNNDYFDDVYEHNGRPEPYTGYCTDVFFREAMHWMGRQRADGAPFLCYLPTNAPHGPFFVPDKYRQAYAGQDPSTASFFGMIANLDENVGRLLDFLDRTGLADDTIVVFLTDNGTTGGDKVFNAGMRGTKTTLYEGGHRVPCFIRWPAGGLRPPGDVAGLAQSQDLLPTLAELCGLKWPGAPPALDGTSLAPVLRSPAAALPDRMLVVQYSSMGAPRPQRGDAAVLWRDWRLVQDRELYNLADDPAQTRNVLAAHPEVAARMREHYARWWAGVEPRVNEFSRIHVGSAHEPLTRLTPCDWQDVFLDTQGQIRNGPNKSAPWALHVERPGLYEFALRRWPAEADAAIAAGLPKYQGVDGEYRAGTALPVRASRLRIGHESHEAPVSADQKVAAFTARLARGPVDVQTWFLDEAGEPLCGAYYVYIRRVAD